MESIHPWMNIVQSNWQSSHRRKAWSWGRCVQARDGGLSKWYTGLNKINSHFYIIVDLLSGSFASIRFLYPFSQNRSVKKKRWVLSRFLGNDNPDVKWNTRKEGHGARRDHGSSYFKMFFWQVLIIMRQIEIIRNFVKTNYTNLHYGRWKS